MLKTKFQETFALLIAADDFNVPITIAKDAAQTCRLSQEALIEMQWKQYIWKSIGIYSTTEIELHVEMQAVNRGNVKVYNAILAGHELINYFWDRIRCADGVRINITQNGTQMSWIIVRP